MSDFWKGMYLGAFITTLVFGYGIVTHYKYVTTKSILDGVTVTSATCTITYNSNCPETSPSNGFSYQIGQEGIQEINFDSSWFCTLIPDYKTYETSFDCKKYSQ